MRVSLHFSVSGLTHAPCYHFTHLQLRQRAAAFKVADILQRAARLKQAQRINTHVVAPKPWVMHTMSHDAPDVPRKVDVIMSGGLLTQRSLSAPVCLDLQAILAEDPADTSTHALKPALIGDGEASATDPKDSQMGARRKAAVQRWQRATGLALARLSRLDHVQ